ncbi:MAG: glycoside hydrolase family 2 TIM barrel-domain containing protein [Lachnospiraceae bacterium]
MYPQENKSRAVLSLDGIWKFRLNKGEAEKEQWEKHSLTEYENLYVPASYNDQREDAEFRLHCGTAYYEKEFAVPTFFAGQRLVLRFDAVTHDAMVWLDGEFLCNHKGGFLPFEVDVTDKVEPGKTVRLTVCVDNTINRRSLPVGSESGSAFMGSDNAGVPAVEQAKLWRRPMNLPNFDFFNYAGIQRHVRIYTTPAAYIENIILVPDIQGKDGLVSYTITTGGNETGTTAEIANTDTETTDEESGASADNNLVQVRILDGEGNVVATACGKEGTIRIPHAKLWEPYPGTPYLYKAEVTYGADLYTEEFGIRTVAVKGTQVLINNKPFYFKGFGKHEDFYIRGRGTDDCLNVKDIGLLHWIGANSFRTSHYPYAEEMYRLCDKEGIVIIDETPAVGIGAVDYEPYDDTFTLKDYHTQVLKDMIARDCNHPCVIMWSLGNEPSTDEKPEAAYAYWHELYNIAHDTDPQNRPVTLVCCQNNYERDIVTRTMDVVCINRYYGWYNLSGDLDAACYAWNLELDFWEQQNKPVMVSEYGADTIEGLHGTVGEMFTEEFQAEYYRRINAEFDKRSFFVGEHCWAFADFGTLQGIIRADGNRKGVFTKNRRPKLAAHILRERWTAIPNFGYKE